MREERYDDKRGPWFRRRGPASSTIMTWGPARGETGTAGLPRTSLAGTEINTAGVPMRELLEEPVLREERFRREAVRPATTRGGFRGKGPVGYVRSDARIHEDVCDALAAANLDTSEVTVTVKDREVILEGGVESRWAKRMVELIVADVRGVRDVRNRLRVHSPDEGPPVFL
ncbi:MAG: BON domain-containing protein [Myxococcota bacterium]